MLAGWTGHRTNVVVRIANKGGGDRLTIRNAANTAQLPLGTVNLIGDRLRHGRPRLRRDRDGVHDGPERHHRSRSRWARRREPRAPRRTTGTMTLTPTATLTDRAGNTCQTTVANETGAADVEF